MLLVTAVGYSIYSKGYDAAYQERTAYYNQQLLDNNKQLVKVLDSVEKLALVLDTKNTAHYKQLAQDLNKIYDTAKTKPLTNTKNGECVPSQEFLDSYNSIILRGNQK